MLTDEPQDGRREILGKVGWLWLSFQAFAIVLTFAIPETLYSNSKPVRAFADVMAVVFGSIDQFAQHSAFPGITRVVLAILWVCVPPLAILQWRVPGYVRWRPEIHARLPRVVWTVPLIVLGFLWLPIGMKIDPENLTSDTSVDRLIRAVLSWRLIFGFVAGTYCVISAWLLALLPRAFRFLFTGSSIRDPDRR